MSNKRLVGEDGALYKGTPGTAVVSTGSETIAAGAWVIVQAISGASSPFYGLEVNDPFYNNTAATLATTSGDSWKVVTLSQLADVVGASLSLSAEEVDVTVLKDTVRKYRKGKKDATGTISFNFIQDITDVAGGIGNSFFKIVEQADDASITVSDINEDPIFLLLYVNEGRSAGSTSTVTLLEVELFNFDLPLTMSTATSTESTIRLTGDTNPILYRTVEPA